MLHQSPNYCLHKKRQLFLSFAFQHEFVTHGWPWDTLTHLHPGRDYLESLMMMVAWWHSDRGPLECPQWCEVTACISAVHSFLVPILHQAVRLLPSPLLLHPPSFPPVFPPFLLLFTEGSSCVSVDLRSAPVSVFCSDNCVSKNTCPGGPPFPTHWPLDRELTLSHLI